ncbi:UDP-N-acetylmuramoylalanine--D-glutamate ligase [Alkalispirochaeta americana]|uniref:UDP-N-acetylmuramoylalanine--D-glutamate ligase n=1 Tax=Alkalispirochaeta americana TaxID=159291 RepID=A0A1N6NC41_9SPIO|nr:UDP-N-acetylmuramoyl-L-alanine--D-glutamate ligase [Alkalispirochaeta americana]SIP89630.1 UDP-N-acetylmuramoylalanine--D-glutamate ligase [Alkalispirochaeta americana]
MTEPSGIEPSGTEPPKTKPPEKESPLKGRRVTVMGLGLHGGGLAAARYLTSCGARVTVTDLRSPRELAPTLEKLPREVRCVLGEHREEDFSKADLVVKNPAVPRSAPLLRLAPAVTTDIALFLAHWRQAGPSPGPLVAITGTKGKSSTAGATASLLAQHFPGTKLGGNITISPLSFLEELQPGDPVVLELSSFQLGDLRFCRDHNGQRSGQPLPREILFPELLLSVGIITNILPDHQDYYPSLEEYVLDKEELLQSFQKKALCILGEQPPWSDRFRRALARSAEVTLAVISRETVPPGLLPETPLLRGDHMLGNLAMAASAAWYLGVPPGKIRSGAETFSGVPHRLEHLGQKRGISFVNDTAATIPEAAEAASRAYPEGTILLAGGSDKGLDLSPLAEAGKRAVSGGGALVLLAGSATERLLALLRDQNVPFHGPCNSLDEAFSLALELARELTLKLPLDQGKEQNTPGTVLLSPGCASFGMFRNEFDRGNQFRDLVRATLDQTRQKPL